MKNLAILLTKEPYGEINAAEAVRHALGAVAEDLEVSFLLTDGGVFLALKEQETGSTGFMNLGVSLSDCVDMGVSVYANSPSIEHANLNISDLVDGVQVIEEKEASNLIGESDQVIIY
jgi:sulfur relay (sulfurtransferase) DsrF/TusC family protein